MKNLTKFSFVLTLLFLLKTNSFANTYYSRSTGTWTTNATWSLSSGGGTAGTTPGAGDNVIIERGFTVTVNTAASCASLQVGSPGNSGAGVLTFTNGNSLTVSGNVTLGGFGNAAWKGTITFVNTSTLTAANVIMGGTGGTPAPGIITMSAGSTLITGSLAVNTVAGNTWTPSTGTVQMTATNTLPSTIFTTFNNLIVNGGTTTSSGIALTINGTVTVTTGTLIFAATNNNYTITGDLIVPAGATFSHDVDWDVTGFLLSVAGNVSIDGTYNYAAVPRSHLQMKGTGKTIRSGNTAGSAFSLLTILTGSISASGLVTVNDNFWSTLGSTGSFSTNGFVVYANASLFNSGGTLNINGGTLNVTGGLYVGTSVSGTTALSASGTLNADFVDVGVSGAIRGSFTQANGTTANIGDLTINSTTTASSYVCTGSPVINVTGDWSNSGTFTTATSTVTFDGTNNQALGGTNATTFNNLTVSTSSDTITLGNNITVNATLNLTNGIITTGANTVIIPTTGSVSGGSAASYINGTLKKNIISGTTSKTFEIGDANSYTPVTLAFSGSGTNNSTGSITATTTGTDHPQLGLATSGINTARSVNRYWTLTNTGVTFAAGVTYKPTFTFINPGDLDAGTVTGSFIVKRYLAGWQATTTGTQTSTTTQATGLTSAQFGDFAIGDPSGTATSSSVTTSLTPACSGTVVTFTATVTSGGFPVAEGTVTFKDGASTIASNVALNSSGQATASTSALTSGSHSITVVFNATTNFATSTSPILTQVINSSPVPVAGTDIIVCSTTSGAINITTGSSASNYTTLTWTSDGTGTITNANSLTTATYTPSAADISAGGVTLTLTANNALCTAISTKAFTIPVPPTAVAGTAVSTCAASGAVNITAGSSATSQSSIVWTSNGTGVFANATSLTTATYTPSAADISAGSVILTLTANGLGTCTANTSTKTLTINPTPSVSNQTATICGGSTFLVSPTGVPTGTTYSWSAPTGTGFTGGSSASGQSSISQTLTNTTTSVATAVYTVTPTSGACAGSTFTVTVTINPTPSVSNKTATICSNSAFSVIPTGIPTGTTYTWTAPTGTGFTGGSAQVTPQSSIGQFLINTTTSPATATYTVTPTSGSCTGNTFTVTVTINPQPVASITADYCAGVGVVSLTSSSATSYLWSTGATTQSINVNTAGTDSVFVTNSYGCLDTAFWNVATELVVNGNFSQGNTGFTTLYRDTTGANGLQPEGYYAVGPNANFYHTAFFGKERQHPGTGNFMIVNGSGVAQNIWSETITVTPNTNYYYSAYATSMNAVSPYARLQFQINGAQVGTIDTLLAGATTNSGPFNWTQFYGSWYSGSNTTAILNVIDLQTAAGGNDFGIDDISFSTLSPVIATVAPMANGGSPLCSGNTLNLTANVTGGNYPLTYAWTGPNSFSSTSQDPSIPAATTAAGGTYTLSIIDNHGCTASGSGSVVVNQTPSMTSASSASICSGGTVSIPLTSSVASTYTWIAASNANVTGESITTQSTSTLSNTLTNISSSIQNVIYTVTPTSTTGSCSSTQTVTVSVSPTSVGGTASSAQTICSGSNPADLSVSGITGSVTKWQSSTDNFVSSINDIASSAGTTLTSAQMGSLTANRYYRAVVQSSPCTTANSSVILITVSAASVGGTASSAQTICTGSSPANLTVSGITGSVTKWQWSTDNFASSINDIASSASTTLTSALMGSLTANRYYRAVVQSSPCTTANSSVVLITVSAVSVGGTASSAQTICTGSSPANLTVSGITGSVTKWQWSTDNFVSSINDIASSASTTLTSALMGSLTANRYYRAVVQSSPCTTANSSVVLITVSAASVGGTASSAQTICTGSSPANLTVSGITGSVTKWQWSTDNFASSINDIASSASTTLTSAQMGSLTVNTYYRAVVQSSPCTTANSSVVLITVSAASVGGTASSAQTICTGSSPANLTVSGITGSVSKWQWSTDNFVSSINDIAASASTTLTSALMGSLTANRYYRAVVQSSPCTTANSSVVLITVSAASVGGTASSAQTICTGSSPANLTVSGITGSVTKWQWSTDNFVSSINDIAASAGTTLTSAQMGSLTVNTYYRAVVQSSPCTTANSSVVLITVSAASVGGTASSAQTICTGSSPANLTVSGITGSVSKWQWSTDNFVSSINDIASSASTTLTSAQMGSLTVNTYYRAVVQSSPCTTANSSVVLITVSAVSVGGTASSAQTICTGSSPANLTVSGITGSVSKWQWSTDNFVSSINDIAASASTTLTSALMGSLTANRYYRAVVQSSPCTTANSSVILITVSAASVGGTASSAQTICTGSSPANLTVSGITGSVTKWQWSTDNFVSSINDIASSAGTTLMSAQMSSLTVNTYYRAVVQSSPCTTANSSVVLITVSAASVGGTASSAQTICTGSSPANLTVSGITGSVSKWQWSTDNFVSSINDITSSAGTTLTSAQMGSLTVNTYYRAVVQSSPCTTANSSVILITVSAASVGGTASSAQTICTGSSPANLTVSGITGSVSKWQWSTDNFVSSINDITSSASTTLTSAQMGSLTVNTYYRAVVQSSPCTTANSSVVLITVSAASVGGTASSAQTICTGSSPANLTVSAITGSVTKWQSSTDNFVSSINDIASSASTTLTSALMGSLTANRYYRAVVQSSPCTTANSSVVLITVSAASVGGTASSAQTICTGSSPANLTVSGITGSVTKWQWSTDNFASSINDIASSASTTLTSAQMGSLTVNTYYRAVVQSSPCTTANSSVILITINAASVGGTASSAQTICTGSSPANLTVSGITGSVTKWQWSTDNFASSINDIAASASSTLTSALMGSLTANRYYRAVVQNGVCTIANSSIILVTVNPNATINLTSGAATNAQTPCINTAITNITYSIGGGGAGATIGWTPSTPSGITGSFSGGVFTISGTPSVSGIFNYTVTTTAGTCTQTSATGSVSITAQPTLSSASALATCAGNSATINLTGMVASSTNNTISYKINGVSQTPVTGVNTDASGNASFNTTALTATNNGQTLQVTGIANGSCSQSFTKNTTLVVNASGTWLGVNTNWFDGLNWCGGVPTTTTDVLIPSGLSYYPNVTSGTGTVHNITIQNGGSLIVNGAIMQVSAAISNSGTFDATQGTVEMNGSSAQTISGSSFSTKTILNLIISNTNASGVSLSATANDTLNISGALSFGNVNNAVLNTNDNLTLLSSAAKTARVADITNAGVNSGNTINGKAVIQRFMPPHRAWRLMTAPVSATSAQTISAAWQEGVVDAILGQRINPDPGFGTHITGGPTRNASGVGNTGSNGYDAGPNNASIYSYSGSLWSIPANTSSTIITANSGYLLFVRGDRSTNLSLGIYAPVTSTILRPKGYLKTGTQVFSYSTAAGYHVIGNPFASTINYGSLSALNSNVSSYYYTMDPLMTGSFGVGSFVALVPAGAGTYTAVPDPTTATPTNTAPHPMDLNGSIQSGAAFIVYSNTSSSSLTVREQDKIAGNDTYLFRPQNGLSDIQNLRTNVYAVDAAGANNMIDGVLNMYGSIYSDSVDFMEDVKKVGNPAESFSLRNNGILLTAEKRQPLTASDTIFYNIVNFQTGRNYILEFLANKLDETGLNGTIKDSYTGTSTVLNMDGITTLNVNVDGNAASKIANRFMIVFSPAKVVPVTFTSIKASQQSSNIAVQWKVENELNIKEYVMEKSTDGVNFIKAATVAATGNNKSDVTYNWLDANAVTGENYYRVYSIDNNGAIEYSQIVKVNINAGNPSISVYPNPVTNGLINVQMNNVVKGVYHIRLLDAIGQSILDKEINHSSGSSTETIEYNNKIAKGNYQLEIINPDDSKTAVKLIIE